MISILIQCPKSESLYNTDNRITTVDNMMDSSKQVNEIPYEAYGDMLTNGELIVIKVNYNEAYTIVVDTDGNQWKVTYKQDGFLAILTKVD